MLDVCLVALAKHGNLLLNEPQVDQFLQSWYRINKYSNEIFIYIHQSSHYGNTPPGKIEQKKVLQAKQASKKAKSIDDFTTAKITRIADLRDEWLIQRNKITFALKAKIKKIKVAKNKKRAKVKANQDKNCKTSQIHSMKRFALDNNQIGSFKNVLSNLLIGPSSNSIQLPTPIQPTMATE